MRAYPFHDDQRQHVNQSFDRRTFGQHIAGSALVMTASSTFGATTSLSANVVLDQGKAEGDGIELFYVRAGEGKLIVFLHGVPDRWFLYEPYLREFGQDHLAVAPNLRGYRPTGQPEAVDDYKMRHFLEDTHRLLDHFDRESCILVANDWGAYFAWVFASAYPDRVERLVIMNGGHPSLVLRDYQSSPEQIEASQYERFAHLEPMPYPFYIEADPLRVPASIEEAASMSPPNLSQEFFSDIERQPATTSLKVHVPTLVIWGMQDPSQLPGLLDGLGDYVSDLTVVRIDDAGHYPMRTHPDKVMAAIRKFISSS